MDNSPQHCHRGLNSQGMRIQGTRSTIIKSILCYSTVGDARMAMIIVAYRGVPTDTLHILGFVDKK